MSAPTWWRPEYFDNPILYRCAHLGYSAEQALSALSEAYLLEGKRMLTFMQTSAQPIVVLRDCGERSDLRPPAEEPR